MQLVGIQIYNLDIARIKNNAKKWNSLFIMFKDFKEVGLWASVLPPGGGCVASPNWRSRRLPWQRHEACRIILYILPRLGFVISSKHARRYNNIDFSCVEHNVVQIPRKWPNMIQDHPVLKQLLSKIFDYVTCPCAFTSNSLCINNSVFDEVGNKYVLTLWRLTTLIRVVPHR